ncbi:MAG: hypothetical protein ACRDPY_20930 [Streptosporangiaceae bacterium]
MTADGTTFGRLLYTDCRAGMGRGAGGGFQVQAQSDGVDSAQARMAVGWLLYEAQNAWIVERRPVEEFPLGFAHACETGYGTAQSCYLGKEASGGRPGNHLADCLLTREPARYGATRPAQLWRSELWRSEPWETKDCPPFTDEPPLGPLTVEAVTEWLKEDAERPGTLARLVSVLEDPGGRRIVIVAAEADEALRWIAAATLLLPARVALDVSFKVFSSNPLRAEQRVVAVPTELNKQFAPGRGDTVFVLDAASCAFDEVPVSERARFFAERLAGIDDPYDVLDAVELAASLGGGDRLGGADARLTAWALTRPDDQQPDTAALFRWLSRADLGRQREHGAAVAGLLLGGDPPAGVLRWIDETVAHRVIGLDPAPVRARLLGAELAEARQGKAAPGDLLAGVQLGADAWRDAESELSSAILLGSDAQVDMLLRLARRHGIEPELAAPLWERLQDFVAGWLDRRVAYDPDVWSRREEILDLAHQALRDRLIQGGLDAVRAPLSRLIPYLIDRAGDPTDPLDWHLRAAAMARLPSGKRRQRLAALLQRAAWDAEAAAGLQEALLAWHAVGPAEAELILDYLPASAGILPGIAAQAFVQLERMGAKPSEHMLDMLASLDRHRLAPATGPYAELLAADHDVMAFVDASRTEKFAADARYLDSIVARLERAAPEVVRLRMGHVLRACLDCPQPRLGGAVLGALDGRDGRARELIRLWAGDLARGDLRAVIWGVNCLADTELPGKRRDQMTAAIRDYAEALSKISKSDYEKWYQEVQRYLPADASATWSDLAGENAQKPRKNLWINRDGGR